MDVSIVIINYNTFELTCRCISHVLEKTSGVEFEIIVVDNASTERDPNAFLEKFPLVKLVANPVNVGFAKGNNAGIAIAAGECILLLNSDAFLINNVILKLFSFLKLNPEIAAVTGKLEYPDGKVQHNCQRFPSIGYKVFELFRLQKLMTRSRSGKILFGSFFAYDQLVFPDWVWGTCFMFKKSLPGTLPQGKLSEDFFMYGEDMQWCKEFRKRGYKIAFLPEPRIEHLMGASGASKKELMKANYQFFLKKYYPGWKIQVMEWLDTLLQVK